MTTESFTMQVSVASQGENGKGVEMHRPGSWERQWTRELELGRTKLTFQEWLRLQRKPAK